MREISDGKEFLNKKSAFGGNLLFYYGEKIIKKINVSQC